MGTNANICGFMVLPELIEELGSSAWLEKTTASRALASKAHKELEGLFAGFVKPFYESESGQFAQMVSFPLPKCEHMEVKKYLLDKHSVDVASFEFSGAPVIRLSFQVYNEENDLENLLKALRELF